MCCDVFPTLLASLAIAVSLAACKPGGGVKSASQVEVQSELPVYQRVCKQCHGAAGEGNVELKTPSIAGQPRWYLETQLEKFCLGWRGADPKDVFGQQMRAIALALQEGEAEEAISTVITFSKQPTTTTFKADLINGKLIFEEQCMECHRYNGSGEKVFGSSPLTAFQDWYLAAQLEKFRLGVRGYHGEDEKGQQMRHLASYLSEGEVRDVSAYIATLAKRYPPKRR